MMPRLRRSAEIKAFRAAEDGKSRRVRPVGQHLPEPRVGENGPDAAVLLSKFVEKRCDAMDAVGCEFEQIGKSLKAAGWGPPGKMETTPRASGMGRLNGEPNRYCACAASFLLWDVVMLRRTIAFVW
jgi:hypothetical protein